MAKPKQRAKRGTGTIVKRGRKFGVRYVENGVRQFVGGFETRGKAEEERAAIALRLKANQPGVPREPDTAPVISSLVDDWLASRKGKQNDVRAQWMKHVHPCIGSRRVNEVTRQTISRMVDELRAAGEISEATTERVLYVISAFYRWANGSLEIQGVEIRNPVQEYLAKLGRHDRKLLRSQHDPASTPFLKDPADVLRIYAKLKAPLNIVYAISARAGLRPGEALALEWADVDLDRGIIKVSKRVRAGKLVRTTKGGKPRQVSMTPWLVGELKQWRAKIPEAVLVAPSVSKKFRHKEGRVGANAVRFALEELLPKLDLPVLTFYEAGRHSYASHWAMAGLDLYRLKDQLGHASIETTQRYAHLTAGVPADLLARLDGAGSRPGPA